MGLVQNRSLIVVESDDPHDSPSFSIALLGKKPLLLGDVWFWICYDFKGHEKQRWVGCVYIYIYELGNDVNELE